jgi:uncharacterized protein (DUF2062 family)
MISAGITAIALKLNKFITIAASNISIPPMIPIILYASYVTGGLVMRQPTTISLAHISFETLGTGLLQYVVGSLLLAGTVGFIFGLVSYFLLTVFRKSRAK